MEYFFGFFPKNGHNMPPLVFFRVDYTSFACQNQYSYDILFIDTIYELRRV